MATSGHIPAATVDRLPVYLRALLELARTGITTVSSEDLALRAGVTAAKVRKDLSHLGTYGTRGVGYDVEFLAFEVSRALGVAHHWPVAVVGVGNLGRALVGHADFARRGFPVVAAFDVADDIVGTVVEGVEVSHLDELAEVVAARGVAIAVITTPAAAAQGVADALVAAGIRSIMSFAPTVVTVPEGVSLRAVDIASELQILGFHLQRADPATPPAGV